MSDLRTEAMKMALEALDAYSWEQVDAATKALRKALAQPEQEPVAWLNMTSEGKRYIQFAGSIKDFHEGTRFYTAPPKREWQGLTGDDKHFLLANAWNKEQAFDGFMDAIDKFLKEKNT